MAKQKKMQKKFPAPGPLSQIQWVYWMGFQLNAWNKACGYHRHEIFTYFVLGHKNKNLTKCPTTEL